MAASFPAAEEERNAAPAARKLIMTTAAGETALNTCYRPVEGEGGMLPQLQPTRRPSSRPWPIGNGRTDARGSGV
jgi:hypothetical protein